MCNLCANQQALVKKCCGRGPDGPTHSEARGVPRILCDPSAYSIKSGHGMIASQARWITYHYISCASMMVRSRVVMFGLLGSEDGPDISRL